MNMNSDQNFGCPNFLYMKWEEEIQLTNGFSTHWIIAKKKHFKPHLGLPEPWGDSDEIVEDGEVDCSLIGP